MENCESKTYPGGRGVMVQVHREIKQFPAIWELLENGRPVLTVKTPSGTTDRQLTERLLDLASILCRDAGFTPDSIAKRFEGGLLANCDRGG